MEIVSPLKTGVSPKMCSVPIYYCKEGNLSWNAFEDVFLFVYEYVFQKVLNSDISYCFVLKVKCVIRRVDVSFRLQCGWDIGICDRFCARSYLF